ncbi:hypothetical protein DES37_10985 [Mangrovibacter plantisponsor]|uniref:Uncharacterized protein n=1 Tax=Mangrovibacter plantisponsor TaxID=451513 RepID=A0A317PW61_9ENTR|nr:hypothetical protein DES37_10985 [Mangrovibacter plantisponsor]
MYIQIWKALSVFAGVHHKMKPVRMFFVIFVTKECEDDDGRLRVRLPERTSSQSASY